MTFFSNLLNRRKEQIDARKLSTEDQQESRYRVIRFKKQDPKIGSTRTLEIKQENQLKKAIYDKCQDQMELPFALWPRKAD